MCSSKIAKNNKEWIKKPVFFSSECLPMEAVIRFHVDQPPGGGLGMLFASVAIAAMGGGRGGLHEGQDWRLFLCLLCLFGGLGYLTTGRILEVDCLDDANSDRLSHITHRKTSQRRELLE